MKTIKVKAYGTQTIRGNQHQHKTMSVRTKRIPIVIDGKVVGYETVIEDKGMKI
ncbi:hypothetical protein LCGC14_0363070 [marine sediment metagenome]|uniref:Uncharacterized protein n=1 Tax=marine sediment metagenome TaxID=412755 RepID=A0A0F9VUG5_9ZZZZ